jgi:hypothetical protein
MRSSPRRPSTVTRFLISWLLGMMTVSPMLVAIDV